MSPEMRSILRVQSNKKPTRNFLVENVKNLREMQLNMEASKKATEEQAKKEKKKRSPFTNVRGINKPAWVRLKPSSSESISGRSGDSNTTSREEGPLDIQLKSPKQYIEQGVQTSPSRDAVHFEEEDLSQNIIKPTTPPSNLKSAKPIASSSTSSPSKLAIANSKRENAINKVLKESGINYVELNRRMEYKPKVMKEKSDPAAIPKNYQLGKLPRYLKEMKKPNHHEGSPNRCDGSYPIDDEQSLDLLKEDEHRPGHILLSDDERLEHLRMMNKCYEELLLQFNQLPIRSDSLKAKQKRADLEKQLENLEKSMKLFSREKLYIKL